MEDQENRDDSMSASTIQQMLSFIKEDLGGITKRYFMEPISGVQALSKDSSSAAPLRAMTLMLLGALLCYLGFRILLGDASKSMDMGDHLVLLAMPIIFMLVMTSISFGIKKATSSGGDLKEELTTGALYTFPLVLAVVLSIAFRGELISSSGPYEAFESSLIFTAALGYVSLMMVNTIMQSMKASGVSELLSWYISPAGVILGCYLTFKILRMVV